MILNIDLSGKELVVTQRPEPKVDAQGKQRHDKKTGEPMWSTQVVVTDGDGGEVIRISTGGASPGVQVGDKVKVTGLVAIPWSSGARVGMAYRADAIAAID